MPSVHLHVFLPLNLPFSCSSFLPFFLPPFPLSTFSSSFLLLCYPLTPSPPSICSYLPSLPKPFYPSAQPPSLTHKHTHFTHPLVAASFVDWSDHLQVKSRIQMAVLLFLCRSLHPEQTNRTQKIKQSLTAESCPASSVSSILH